MSCGLCAESPHVGFLLHLRIAQLAVTLGQHLVDRALKSAVNQASTQAEQGAGELCEIHKSLYDSVHLELHKQAEIANFPQFLDL